MNHENISQRRFVTSPRRRIRPTYPVVRLAFILDYNAVRECKQCATGYYQKAQARSNLLSFGL